MHFTYSLDIIIGVMYDTHAGFYKELLMKYMIDINYDLVEFFRKNVDDTEPVEVLLVKMLKLLRELLKLTHSTS